MMPELISKKEAEKLADELCDSLKIGDVQYFKNHDSRYRLYQVVVYSETQEMWVVLKEVKYV